MSLDVRIMWKELVLFWYKSELEMNKIKVKTEYYTQMGKVSTHLHIHLSTWHLFAVYFIDKGKFLITIK